MRFIVSWGTPILIQAVIIWLIICVLGLPLLALFYRTKYGRIPASRMILAPLVLFYVVGIISFTFLPLPDPDTFQCSPNLHYPRFYPGWSLRFALANTEGMGLASLLDWWFVQIYLNVVLFIPWGIIARWAYKLSFRATLLSAFVASLFIELTQLTGIWGIYSCRYRTFDVDDMITNSLGAVIGWGVAALLMYFPRAHSRSEQ